MAEAPQEIMQYSIYLSGPISGVPEYWLRFLRAETFLRRDLLTRATTPRIYNPARLPRGWSNRQYMHAAFAAIDESDIVILLPGWEDSTGAKLEKDYAGYTGKATIIFAELYPDVNLDETTTEEGEDGRWES